MPPRLAEFFLVERERQQRYLLHHHVPTAYGRWIFSQGGDPATWVLSLSCARKLSWMCRVEKFVRTTGSGRGHSDVAGHVECRALLAFCKPPAQGGDRSGLGWERHNPQNQCNQYRPALLSYRKLLSFGLGQLFLNICCAICLGIGAENNLDKALALTALLCVVLNLLSLGEGA